MTDNNKLISTVPTLEEILQQLPFTETINTPVIKITAIIKATLLLGTLYTLTIFMLGNNFYPTALKGGLIFGLLMGLVLGITRLCLKKLCSPYITTIDKEGIHGKAKNRKEITILWFQIAQFSKVTMGANTWIKGEINPQIDKSKLPKRIALKSNIYDIDTSIIILEMLRQYLTSPPEDQDS